MSAKQQPSSDELLAKLTAKQRQFVLAYADTLNATKAALRAGYSEKSAKSVGSENLTKPDIKAAINAILKEKALSPEEATLRLSDVATSRLNDYLTVTPALRTPRVRKPLQQLIDELRKEIELYDAFFDAGLIVGNGDGEDGSDKAIDRHHDSQRDRNHQITRYEVELRLNPDAYRDTTGESIWVDEVSVDLVALAKADRQGLIKSITFHDNGQPNKVELHSAADALEKILQLHGKFVQKVELTPGEGATLKAWTAADVLAYEAWQKSQEGGGSVSN